MRNCGSARATDGQPALLAMEMAASADAPHLGMRAMKSLVPDYLSVPLDAAPRQFWELLFPLPYRGELAADARGTAWILTWWRG